MRCEGCGEQLRPDVASCHECGEPVDGSTPSYPSAPSLPPPPVQTAPKSSPDLKAITAPPAIKDDSPSVSLPADPNLGHRISAAPHAAGYAIAAVVLLIAMVVGRWYVATERKTNTQVVIGARASTLTADGHSSTASLSRQGSVFSHFASAGLALLVGLGLSVMLLSAAAIRSVMGRRSSGLGLGAAVTILGGLITWWVISRNAASIIDAEMGASVYLALGAVIATVGSALYDQVSGTLQPLPHGANGAR